MTAAASSPEPRQRWLRLAHYQFPVSLTGAVVFALSLIPLPFRSLPIFWQYVVGWSWLGVLAVLLALLLVVQWAEIPHSRRLCLLCVDGVDPGDALRANRMRNQLVLIFFHLTRTPLWIAFEVLVFGALLVPVFWVSEETGNYLSFLCLTVLMFLTAWAAWAGRQHRKMWPWCPVCRDDGDWGMREQSPVPGPQMTKAS